MKHLSIVVVDKKGMKMDSDEEDEEGVRVMPSEAHRKKKQKNAMEDLLSKRKEKEGMHIYYFSLPYFISRV